MVPIRPQGAHDQLESFFKPGHRLHFVVQSCCSILQTLTPLPPLHCKRIRLLPIHISLPLRPSVMSRALAPITCCPIDDDIMWSDRPSHVSERCADKVGLELQSTVFGTYMISENTWVPVMLHTTDGSLWVCERHPDNLRGDASTIASRKGSVERIGVLTGVRSGPWLLPRDEVTVVLLSDQSTGKRTIVQR